MGHGSSRPRSPRWFRPQNAQKTSKITKNDPRSYKITKNTADSMKMSVSSQSFDFLSRITALPWPGRALHAPTATAVPWAPLTGHERSSASNIAEGRGRREGHRRPGPQGRGACHARRPGPKAWGLPAQLKMTESRGLLHRLARERFPVHIYRVVWKQQSSRAMPSPS